MAEERRPAARSTGPEILRLARRDRDAGRDALAGLGPEAQASACLELRPELRVEFLMLCEQPEAVVPLLGDAEVASIARATGMEEAPWLLELASPDQLRACFDLDCWQGARLETERGREWLEALVEAGSETLARGVEAADPEVWVLLLRSLTEVAVLGKEDDKPDGWLTVDGTVWFGVRDGVNPSLVQQTALALLEHAPDLYWKLVLGVIYEAPSDAEEWALRWRAGRLADQGFPEYEQAMRAYRPLRPEQAPIWERVEPGAALVAAERLPRQLQGSLVGEALAKLPGGRAADVLGYVLGVANSIAVADWLRLSDHEAIPGALAKAVRGIDRGLRELATRRAQPVHEVLDSTAPLDLFRIGQTLDPELRRPQPPPEPADEEDESGALPDDDEELGRG